MKEKRVAVVTGSGKGIGRCVAEVLADQGYTVLLVARNSERLEKTSKEINSSGGNSEPWPCDITDRPAVAKLIKSIKEHHGQIDVLVNMAGLMPFPSPLHEMSDDLWDDLINTNLTGTYNVTKAVLPVMLERKYGRIINISSVSALKTVANFVAYAAAKGALHAFTTSLAQEVTSKGITVNCVAPGFTETEEMHRIWGTLAEQSGITEDEMLSGFWAQIPIGRWIQPGEIAKTVAYLASEDTAVVSGQILVVDGGYDSHA